MSMFETALTRTALVVLLIGLTGCVSPPYPGLRPAASENERIDDLPMYGQPEIQRPDFLKKADQQFIEEATQRVGGREQASHAWWTAAELHMKERQLHLAMRRYNQAWLLDPQSYKPYWGFARITLQRDQFDEAIGFFDTAKKLCRDDFQRAALLADSGTAYSSKAESLPATDPERSRFFRLANEDFEKAVRLDAAYPGSWRQWAISLCREGEIAAAKEKAARAEALHAAPLPESCEAAIRGSAR